MYDPDSIRAVELNDLVHRIEQNEQDFDDDIHLEEVFPQGNLWAADPAELAEITEEHPVLKKYIRL